MATSLCQCARMLSDEGVRHHVDAEQGVIRVVFVTRAYLNLRGERLAVVRIDTPDAGCRCRVAIERAFSVGHDAAAACLHYARLAADTPLIGFEFDADREDLRLVAEVPVEDGELTPLQLLSLVDRIVEAAELWHAVTTGATAMAGTAHRGWRESA
jgi:hypothetical protein